MTLQFLAILVVVNSAIWVYFDAARLRDGHHTGIGPMSRAPQAWSALVLFFWPVVFPLYLSKARDAARSQPLREGPPPLFESTGLNVWGYLSLLIFSAAAVVALLYFNRPGWAVAALAGLGAGVFGGRKSKQSRREQRFELGKAAWDMASFRPVDEGDMDDGEATVRGGGAWQGGTDLPPIADRAGNLQASAPAAARPSSSRPNLPADVFAAPGSTPPTPDSTPPPPPPPAPSPASPNAPPDATSEGVPPRRPVIATDTRRLAEKARCLQAGDADEEDWEEESPVEESSAPPPPAQRQPAPSSPQSPPRESPQGGRQAPAGASASHRPAAAPANRSTPPAPAPRTAGERSARPPDERATQPASYGGYAASSGSGGGVSPLVYWLGGIAVLCLAVWVWDSGFLGGDGESSPAEDVPAATESAPAEETTPAPAPAEEDPDAAFDRAMEAWIEEYDRLMRPIARWTEEIDFEGFTRASCGELTRTVQLAQVSLPESPDEQIERLLRPAFPYLASAASACNRELEETWSYNLLRAKDHTHEAQVLMDERYQYSGFLELEQESAIGVTRPTSSMSGRYLQENE